MIEKVHAWKTSSNKIFEEESEARFEETKAMLAELSDFKGLEGDALKLENEQLRMKQFRDRIAAVEDWLKKARALAGGKE